MAHWIAVYSGRARTGFIDFTTDDDQDEKDAIASANRHLDLGETIHKLGRVEWVDLTKHKQ